MSVIRDGRLVPDGALVTIVAGGAFFIQRGNATIATFVALFGLWTIFNSHLNTIVRILPELGQILAAWIRIQLLFDIAPEVQTTVHGGGTVHDGEDTVDWSGPVGVSIVDLSYHFDDGDVAAVDNIRLEIAPAESVGLVGRTGSGKSTLVKLITRAEEPSPGTVFIGGVDVCAIPLRELRAHIGVLNQKVEILRASVRDNIALFDRSISDARILDAAQRLGIAEWVERLRLPSD